jgi:hypothetical protein
MGDQVESTDQETINSLSRIGFIASAAAVSIIGLLLAFESEMDEGLGIVAAIALVALIGNYAYYTGQARQGSDERLIAIANKAMSISWYLTLVVILALLGIVSMGSLDIAAGQILGIAVLVMVPSMVIINEIKVRRGEA